MLRPCKRLPVFLATLPPIAALGCSPLKAAMPIMARGDVAMRKLGSKLISTGPWAHWRFNADRLLFSFPSRA